MTTWCHAIDIVIACDKQRAVGANLQLFQGVQRTSEAVFSHAD